MTDLGRLIGERAQDAAACPTHGLHPHNGATCGDCGLCRPKAALDAADSTRFLAVVRKVEAEHDELLTEVERLRAAAPGRTEQARNVRGEPAWISPNGAVVHWGTRPSNDWRQLLVATDAPQQDGPVVPRLRLGGHHKDTVYRQLGPEPDYTRDPRVAVFLGDDAADMAAAYVALANGGSR